MTPDQERWAEALAVVRMHGDGAVGHVARRIRDLAGDDAGQRRWRKIGSRIERIAAARETPN